MRGGIPPFLLFTFMACVGTAVLRYLLTFTHTYNYLTEFYTCCRYGGFKCVDNLVLLQISLCTELEFPHVCLYFAKYLSYLKWFESVILDLSISLYSMLQILYAKYQCASYIICYYGL
jgi:hypothetical protein